MLRPVVAVADARRVAGAFQAVTGTVDAPAVFARRDEWVTGWNDQGQVAGLKSLGAELIHGHGRLDGHRRVAVATPDGGDLLGKALSRGRRGNLDELMANTAAYSGLRWGELTALTIGQVETVARVIMVDRKVVEIAGHLYIEAPKNRKYRRTIYPRRTPANYPLAEIISAHIEAARSEQAAGLNPLGLIFPSPKFKLCRSSNFSRNVLQHAYARAGWRDERGYGRWTWHSLRHVFCTTALFAWKLDPTDVSCMAGHANVRTTLLMYVGTTAGVLDRARKATD